MAKSKKPAGGQPEEIDHLKMDDPRAPETHVSRRIRPAYETAILVPETTSGPAVVVVRLDNGDELLVNVEEAGAALIERCAVADEWNLRVTAERLEAQAARLRAEWRRRRGE